MNKKVKIDDTTAFGMQHHDHNKHRVYIDGLSHKEALMLKERIESAFSSVASYDIYYLKKEIEQLKQVISRIDIEIQTVKYKL